MKQRQCSALGRVRLEWNMISEVQTALRLAHKTSKLLMKIAVAVSHATAVPPVASNSCVAIGMELSYPKTRHVLWKHMIKINVFLAFFTCSEAHHEGEGQLGQRCGENQQTSAIWAATWSKSMLELISAGDAAKSLSHLRLQHNTSQ